MLIQNILKQKKAILISFLTITVGVLPLLSVAAPLRLAKSPLADSTTSQVLPNLMFIIDNSGSMRQDYTPDYMSSEFGAPGDGDRNCLDSGDNDGDNLVRPGVGTGSGNGANRFLDMCIVGDVPFMSADMNNQYYNPAITYSPGVNADGTSLPAQNAANTANFTAVPTDPYTKQRFNMLKDAQITTNLITSFPDRLWCTVTNPTPAQRLDPNVCRRNNNYTFPNDTFRFGRFNGSPNQTVNAGMLDNVIFATGAPYYYSVIPTEYCTASDLKTCVTSSVPTGAFVFPARSRWCKDLALTNCQAVNTPEFKFPRYVGAPIPGVAAVGSIRVSNADTGVSSLNSLTVNGVQILAGAGPGCGTATSNSFSGTGSTRRNLFANAIVARINSCVSNPEYTAVSDGASNPTITITSTVAAGAAGNGDITRNTTNSIVDIVASLAGGVTAAAGTAPYTFTRVDIVSTRTTYPKSVSRTDCAGAVGPTGCSYQEEMTNFANWYAYYRTRMQGMKSAASRAFRTIDSEYRVGFVTINGLQYLPIARFDSGIGQQKSIWYSRLFAADPATGGGTPLRSGLANVGRMFAGRQFSVAGSTSGATVDPIQYSCQQNFALLTTDGYWNTDTAATVRDLNGATIGNTDGGSTPKPLLDGLNASTTLADVAKYYYDTDLRAGSLGNCTGALGIDVCPDNVFISGNDNNNKQHMTTFTLGLGVDGTLLYQSDYRTATTGDFASIRSGAINWPVPADNQPTAVDDLWHAAVNGQGVYFSAKDPAQLSRGLNDALSAIDAATGTGSAAATSALNPVAGDNFAYVASYTTSTWTGNLEARTIDTETGAASRAATWCAEDIIETRCNPGQLRVDGTGSGGDTKYYCINSGSGLTFNDCDAGATGCTEVGAACTGKMRNLFTTEYTADTRRILFNKNGGLQPFLFGNLSGAQQNFFNAAYLSAGRLSQWGNLAVEQQAVAQGANLVNYLRGHRNFESRSGNAFPNNVFRVREATLGDIVNSRPEFVGEVGNIFLDPGYAAFKATTATKTRMVYVGGNDGMLHAFNADTGLEVWAFVPTEVMKNMWKLADDNYDTKHDYFVNSAPVAQEICIAACSTESAVWKIILVGGLGGGGRGYYALDITNPETPVLLWEFDTTAVDGGDVNMGYSYGEPNFTKLNDGRWVVLLTSGYNNVPEPAVGPGPNNTPVGDTPYTNGNGVGYLYVVDPMTGAKLRTISTGTGSVSDPSGLAQTALFASDPLRNLTAEFVYAGDLLGNVWKFDINDGSVSKLATLVGSGGKAQPITAAPVTSEVEGRRIVFVGTGQYLQIEDLTNTDPQTIYAITDTDTPTLVNARTALVQQTISESGNSRTGTNNDVNYDTKRGWFIDLPVGERQHISAELAFGTLIVPTTVPSNVVCSPGGTGWISFFNFETGGPPDLVNQLVSIKTSSPPVGITLILINGIPKALVSEAGRKDPQLIQPSFSTSTSGFQTNRAIWREFDPTQ